MKNSIFLFLFLMSVSLFSQKIYKKIYFEEGNLKSEGWQVSNEKNGYWKFYHKNGEIKEEGHFKDNLKTKYWYFYRDNSVKIKEGHFNKGKQENWWMYYDDYGNIVHKCQLKNNQKNGYCFLYKNKKLNKAMRFKNGKKMDEWTDFTSFRKENNLNDLR